MLLPAATVQSADAGLEVPFVSLAFGDSRCTPGTRPEGRWPPA